jgi:hypothetical protein
MVLGIWRIFFSLIVFRLFRGLCLLQPILTTIHAHWHGGKKCPRFDNFVSEIVIDHGARNNVPPVRRLTEICITNGAWRTIHASWLRRGFHSMNVVWGEHPISPAPCADVNSLVMKSCVSSQNKNSANTQPSVVAASSNQTAIAARPSRAGVTRSASDFYLSQGAFSVSMKLIGERASITTPRCD